MNRILRLSVSPRHGRQGAGLNGLVFDDALGGCDLFTGPNNAGKTTRLLALSGLLSGLAATPTDPKRPYVGPLPADTEVSAEVQTDAGPRFVSRPLDVSKGKEYTEASGRVKELLGSPVCAMDLRDFASSTAGERGKLLDAVARAGGAIQVWDVPRAQLQVRHVLTRAVPSDPETARSPVPSLAEYDACIGAISTADTGADWLTNALVWAEERQKVANKAQKDAAAHAKELALTRAIPLPGAEKDAAREEELRRDLVRLDDATRDRVSLSLAKRRHEDEGARLLATAERIKREGLALRAAIDHPDDKPDEAIPADLLARVEVAKAELDKPIPAPGVDIEALRGDVGSAEATHEDAVKSSNAAKAAHKTAEETASVAYTAMDLASGDAADARNAYNRIHVPEPADYGTCCHCHSADPLGLEGKRAAALQAQAEAATVRDAAETAAEQARAAWKTANVAAEVTEKARASAETAAERAWLRLDAARQALTRGQDAVTKHEPAVRSARKTALDRAEGDVARERARITNEVARWQVRDKQRRADKDAKLSEYKAAVAAHETWKALPVPVVPADTDDSEKRNAIATELQAIRTRNTQRAGANATNAKIEAAGVAATEAVETWEEVKRLVAAIRRARDDMASAAYRPIEDAARSLLQGVPDMPIPYFAGPDDYGADVPGTGRTPIHGLGQSARLVAGAAFVFAFAVVSRQPCPVVLLDGLEVLQPAAARVALLAALGRGVKEGKVANVLVTQSGQADAEVEGVTVHVVKREPVAHRAVPVVDEEPEVVPAPKVAPVAVVEEAGDDEPF